MNAEHRSQLVEEELSSAQEELRAAETLIGIALYRIAMTRIYFATFHAARAMLFARDLEPKTHQGVLTLFNLHWVKPGHAPPTAALLVARLQKFREQADYGEAFVVDAETAQLELAAAREFVSLSHSATSPP